MLNPSLPDINMHVLNNVLYKFPEVLIRRICLIIKNFFSWWSFSFILVTLMCDSRLMFSEKLHASHSYGSKNPTKHFPLPLMQ